MLARIILAASLLVMLPAFAGPQTPPNSAAASAGTIACRVLEAHSDDALKVSVVVFHQRDEGQRSQLAELLREHSGTMVEVQAGQGSWQRARLARLKSCFGRGLLMLRGTAHFSEHAEFVLRLPPDSAGHSEQAGAAPMGKE